MSLELAIFLGILQGITEFFPVSSSGHLALFAHWFGMKEADLTFDILVHLATLGAIIVYFRRDWLQLFRLVVGKERGDLPPLIIPYILVSMIPAAAVGIFLKDHIEWLHERPALVGCCLLFTAVVLLLGLKIKDDNSRPFAQISWGIVLAMAFSQALAVCPGISRAGMTIMAGLFLGMERHASARFSFLMAVPVIGGAGVLAVKDLLESSAHLDAAMVTAYSAGFVAAGISGFFALAFLMKLLDGRRFFYFGFYCFAMGLFAIFNPFV